MSVSCPLPSIVLCIRYYRTHALVGAMRKSNATVANMYVDYIYMDEAQDNLIGDTVCEYQPVAFRNDFR